MLRATLAILAAVIGATVAAVLVGTWRWNRDTAAIVAQLAASGAPDASRESLETLPPPVQRYFAVALREGQPPIKSAVATQDAEFFINGAWRPLTATQHFRAWPPAFVWNARIQMAPMMPALVRDSYIDGHGAMKAAMFGAYSLASVDGLHELNLGALQRFLGEAIWLPTALLPSRYVRWRPKDDRSSVVTLNDRGLEVSLVFEFDDTGMVKTISGDRYQEVQDHFVLKKWVISCGDARQQADLRIPMHCEVAWVENGVPVPYWRGRITSIQYAY